MLRFFFVVTYVIPSVHKIMASIRTYIHVELDNFQDGLLSKLEERDVEFTKKSEEVELLQTELSKAASIFDAKLAEKLSASLAASTTNVEEKLAAANAAHAEELAATSAAHAEKLAAANAAHAEKLAVVTATHAEELARVTTTHAKLEEELAVERAIVKEYEENNAKEIAEYTILVEKYNKLKGKYFMLKNTPSPSTTPGDANEADGGDQVDDDGGNHAEANIVGDDIAPSFSYGGFPPSRPLKKHSITLKADPRAVQERNVPDITFELPSVDVVPSGEVYHSSFGLSDYAWNHLLELVKE